MMRAATARLFVALDPPAEVREQLAAWARTALGAGHAGASESRALRVLLPDLLHLTLCFLGSRPAAEIEPIATALGECAAPVGELSIGAPLWLPPRRPRTLAVEVHSGDGRLAELQRSVGETLAEVTGWPPDCTARQGGGGRSGRAGGRRFRPHITLARMREGAAPRERELPPTPQLAFTPPELILYRSWLAPDGASYEPLAKVTLTPA
jgi:2'-5' RNA ligase